MNSHKFIFQLILFIILPFLLLSCEKGEIKTDETLIVDYNLWEIKNGKFFLDGNWVFLKIAKPLRNFAQEDDVNKLIKDLDILKEKKYNTIEINCYWHHFDTDGDGIPDKSLEPLNKLIHVIYAKGMYPCLSVETYSVGGGQIPAGFWSIYPDAYAIDDKGNKVNDTEYGFGHNVVSIFHPGYRETVHTFIKSLANGIDTKKILYFETTVEPQYMGTINLCYSENAKNEYKKWRTDNNITDSASEMPVSFPISSQFLTNESWNKFRAQFLAKWVNEDAEAYREIAGKDAFVAVDFLDADEKTTIRRNGNPIEFLSHLHSANIIQVNWSWYFPSNSPNQKAYDRVHQVMNQLKRDWAITEHMTFNGSDFVNYNDATLQKILMNTLNQGTRFGWEFVNVANSTNDPFSVYNDNWSPKRVMNAVDSKWDYWMEQVKSIEQNQ